ncbi:hypothetical protein DUNSADRAFT_13158 [Dunaliella salina]|uniref:Encoded protein n=1 Tax=Dunaliella salina TaxID=3046 RepID=A0ABQ7G9Y8_DUNSA|nr:hypothetical protein DUNSADRAFT_13158 [Dunaliella salina]|eukprot:KAF5831423.1 hypothetical protein DUNSADRAFT_13158 [Dunaliella salina]
MTTPLASVCMTNGPIASGKRSNGAEQSFSFNVLKAFSCTGFQSNVASSIKEAQMGGFIRGIDQNVVKVQNHALI